MTSDEKPRGSTPHELAESLPPPPLHEAMREAVYGSCADHSTEGNQMTKDVPTIPLVQARHYTPASRTSVDLVVIHTMEAPEKGTTAEDVAAWFAGPNAPQASAHYCIDNNSVVQTVLEKDVAWHAPGANRNGIGLEHAGFAKQTAAEWADDFSTEMLRRSAELCADICNRYNIPVVFVGPDELKAGARGITTHKAITDGLNGGKGHWDPGPAFPMDQYIAWVQEASAPAPSTLDDDGVAANESGPPADDGPLSA